MKAGSPPWPSPNPAHNLQASDLHGSKGSLAIGVNLSAEKILNRKINFTFRISIELRPA